MPIADEQVDSKADEPGLNIPDGFPAHDKRDQHGRHSCDHSSHHVIPCDASVVNADKEHGEALPLQPLMLEAIRRMVSRHAKRAGSLRSYRLPKLTELLLRDRLLGEINRWYTVDSIVLDGSPILNMAAWACLYSKEPLEEKTLIKCIAIMTGERVSTSEFRSITLRIPEIGHLCRIGLNHMHLPQALILSDLPANIACARIHNRGEQIQPHENEARLDRLRAGWLKVFSVATHHFKIPGVVVDGTRSPDHLLDESAAFAVQTRIVENGKS